MPNLSVVKRHILVKSDKLKKGIRIMNAKRLSLVITLLVVAVLSFSQIFAAGSYGPFNGPSTDSGTCGPDWAIDSPLYRTFVVDQSNTNHVTQNFSGQFTTVAGRSPGACNSGDNGSNVAAGVTGSISGFFDMQVANGVYNPSAVCTPSTCNTTAGFVKTVYGVNATSSVFDFALVYARCDGKQQWQNATLSHGGNVGDINGQPVVCPRPVVAEYQPESCNANSVVLAPYIGHKVRVYLVQASGRQELQFEGSNFVEAGKVNGQSSGKVSVVFYPNSDSWREFEGETLLVTVQGYRDGWYWFPKDSAGHLFCDWSPAIGANAK